MSKLTTLAYKHIRNEILSNHWPDGKYLSMVQVAKKFGMSNTPVREAIIQLENEGIVERFDKIGIRPKRLNRNEIRQLFQMRISLEGGAARFAAESISNEELQILSDILARQKALIRKFIDTDPSACKPVSRPTVWHDSPGANLHVELAQNNFEFHARIITAAKNERFVKISADLHVMTALLRGHVIMTGDSPVGQHVRAYRYHMRILGALKQHDGLAARDWVDNHLLNAMRHHLAAYELREDLEKQGTVLTDEWPDSLMKSAESIQTIMNQNSQE